MFFVDEIVVIPNERTRSYTIYGTTIGKLEEITMLAGGIAIYPNAL